MTNHVDLPNSELHEPKGIKPLTGGATDAGKALVARGDGTSEVRRLTFDDIDAGTGGDVPVEQLSGVYLDSAAPTSVLGVNAIGNRYYILGAAQGAVVEVQLPAPTNYIGEHLYVKRTDALQSSGAVVKLVTVDTALIDGASEFIIQDTSEAVEVVCDGVNWQIVSNKVDLDTDAALDGVFFDGNMATTTVDVSVELKEHYLIGVAPVQTVSVQLPDPALFAGSPITLKRLDSNAAGGAVLKFISFNAEFIEGAAELSIDKKYTSVVLVSDGTDWFIINDVYPEKPLFGFWDYNDLATATTPLNAVASTPLALTNDGAGPFTNKNYKPEGLTEIWNAGGGVFDFTELSLGDTVDMRLDVTVTTTSANQNIDLYLQLGQGGSAYNIVFDTILVKAASTKQLVSFSSVYIGDMNTINNAGQFFILTDSSATVQVNGWYVRVIGTKDTY